MNALWNTFTWNKAVWNGEIITKTETPMIQIVLNLANAKPADVETKLNALAKAQEDNPTVAPDLTLKPADLTAPAAAIASAITRKQALLAAVQSADKDIRAAMKAGKQVIRDYGADVLDKTEKDASKINLLALETRDTSAPAAGAAQNQVPVLSLAFGPNPGSLKAYTIRLPGAGSIEYEVNLTPNAAPNWQHLVTVKGTRAVLTGLPPGALVQIRARGIFSSGPGPWSDVIEHRVP